MCPTVEIRVPRCNVMASYSRTAERRLNYIVLLLLISSFGPYVFPELGVRLEQIVIYSLFVLLIMGRLLSIGSPGLNSHLLTLAALLGLTIVWTSLPTFFGEHPRMSVERVVSGIERFSRPAATILIFALATRSIETRGLRYSLRLSCLVACVLVALNSVLCVTQVFVDTWPVAQFFLRPEETQDQSKGLWQVCVSVGRYSGIFMQPFENGVAHSIGIMAWIYYASCSRKVSVALWVLLGLVTIGGLLSISKAFLFGGISVGLVYLLLSSPGRRIFSWKVALPAVASAVALEEVFDTWKGTSDLMRFFVESDYEMDTLSRFTGARFSSGGSIILDYFETIWNAEPFLGFGFGYDHGFPFDNAWLEFFAQGGLFALSIYCLVLVLLGRLAARGWEQRQQEGSLLIALWILVIGCGFGAPMLTLNRSSTVLWVLVSLCIVIISSSPALRNEVQREATNPSSD